MSAQPAGVQRYAALQRSGASGITVVTPGQLRRAEASPTAPLWVSAPAGNPAIPVPELASAREAKRAGSMRLWLAAGTDNSICLLVFRPELARDPRHAHAVTAVCTPAGEAGNGVVLLQRAAHRNFVAGAVPDRVTNVGLALTSSGHVSAAVTHNTYSITTTRPVRTVAFTDDGVRHQITLDTGGKP